MGKKTFTGFLYCLNGLTAQYFMSFGRSTIFGAYYPRYLLILLIFFSAGLIIKVFENHFSRNVLLFILFSIGLNFLAIFINPNGFITWITEALIALLSFTIGFKLVNLQSFKKRVFSVTGVLLVILVIIFLVNPRLIFGQQSHEINGVSKYLKSTTFQLTGTTGEKIFSDSLKGKVVVLNFWFIGCRPCHAKSKKLEKLAEYYKNNREVAIISIDSSPKDSYAKFLEEALKYSSNIKYAYDNLGNSAAAFGVTGYPTEYILDKTGGLRNTLTGYNEEIGFLYFENTVKRINAILNEN
jgi:cytochrome oxidase Cu insertion factor (SCO1/SenC/PrrC family)